MSKVRFFRFMGNRIILALLLILLFPIGLYYFVMETIVVEREIDNAELETALASGRQAWWRSTPTAK